MKVLITGASSLSAKYFLRTKLEGVDVICTYRSNAPNPAFHLDITDRERIKYALDALKPDIIIHAAAMGDVDVAEKNSAMVRRMELMGTQDLIELSRERGIRFVYMSSNAVFDGENPPYREDSVRNPVNEYGKIKCEAENAVMEHPNWLIIRPILLYGNPYPGSRTNFVSRTLQSLSKGKKIQVVDDTLTQPTYAQDFCEAVWGLLRGVVFPEHQAKIEVHNQIYHVAPEEKLSLYSLTMDIVKIWNFNPELIERAESSDFPSIAPRPKDTTYDLTKLHELGIECRGVVEGLKAMKEEK